MREDIVFFSEQADAGAFDIQMCGITPYHYLLERKAGVAKQLLKNTAMSITEIAHRLGFSNCHYFSAFFSKRAGMSPREYRNL